MNSLHPDDPRLTAYVLGELPANEARDVEHEALLRAEIQAAVEDLILVCKTVHTTYETGPLQLDERRRAAVHLAGRTPQAQKLVLVDRRRRWARAVGVISAAAIFILAGFLVLKNTSVNPVTPVAGAELTKDEEARLRVLLEGVGAPEVLARYQIDLPVAPDRAGVPEISAPVPEDAEYQAIVQLIQDHPDLFFDGIGRERVMAALPRLLRLPKLRENPFVSAREVSRTRIPVTSGTMGYKLVECFVRSRGVLPPRATVRIEELINHVPYHDTGDAVLDDVMLGAELVQCPWDPEKLLLSVLVQNRTDKLLPSDTALSLEVKPEFVSSYRLIGYASGGEASEDLLHRGLGADRSNMVLYELQPASPDVLENTEVICRVGLTLGAENDRALIVPIASPPRDWVNSSLNVRTAAVIAGYGMVLRESDYCGELDAELLGQLAQEVLSDEKLVEPQQQEALELVRDSLGLMAASDR